MLEFLDDQRVFFYEKKRCKMIVDKNNYETEEVEWNLIRRMGHLGRVETRSTDILECVSEDFIYFIDIDAHNRKFIIRSMDREEALYAIPGYLMHFGPRSDPTEQFFKFKWIGNEMLRIVNRDGMEKLVDIGTDFQEYGFNHVDNFDENETKNYHFYH